MTDTMFWRWRSGGALWVAKVALRGKAPENYLDTSVPKYLFCYKFQVSFTVSCQCFSLTTFMHACMLKSAKVCMHVSLSFFSMNEIASARGSPKDFHPCESEFLVKGWQLYFTLVFSYDSFAHIVYNLRFMPMLWLNDLF